MAIGKNYLNQSAFKGTPAGVLIYHNADLSQMSVAATDIPLPTLIMRLEVFHDEGGHFILVPVDPATVTGLSALLQ